MNDKLLNTREAAELLGMRPQTLQVWRLRGNVALPVVRIGGAVRYRRTDLAKYVEEHTSIPGAETATS